MKRNGFLKTICAAALAVQCKLDLPKAPTNIVVPGNYITARMSSLTINGKTTHFKTYPIHYIKSTMFPDGSCEGMSV